MLMIVLCQRASFYLACRTNKQIRKGCLLIENPA